MNEAITKTLHNTFIDEFKKKSLTNFERSELIETYCKNENISLREFARRFDISKSTVSDWCLWSKISQDEYDKLKDKGFNDSEIYRFLRNNELDKANSRTKTEIVLDETITKVNYLIKNHDNIPELLIKIQELKKQVSRLETNFRKTME